jgi:hypothetical protein
LFCAVGAAIALFTTPARSEVVVSGRDSIVINDNHVNQNQTIINYQTINQNLDRAEVQQVVEGALKPLVGPLASNDESVKRAEAQIARQLKALQQLQTRVTELQKGQQELTQVLGSLKVSEAAHKQEIVASLEAGNKEITESTAEIRALILEDRVEQANERIAVTARTAKRLSDLHRQIVSERNAERWRKVGILSAGSVAIAGAAVGVIFSLRAQSTWKDAQAACPTPSACPDNRGNELSNRADNFATVATVGFVASGVALAAAGTLLLWPISDGSESPQAATVALALTQGGGQIALHRRF